jgi:cellulose synthase/poly-beta-1,6-N-acetylglucosamine synthase-like glycosyltransferase
VNAVLVVAAVVVAAPGLLAAQHHGPLAGGARLDRERLPEGPVPPVRFLVLVPAHNEEAVIEPTLAAIRAAARPRDHVVVVADRCTDDTAGIARRHGCLVLERPPGSPPGRAATRQDGLDRAAELDWDAVVMIDADSVMSPGFLDVCERALARGGDALQVRSEAALGGRLVDQASLAAFALQGLTIPRGRDRLGFAVRLRGTGMVLRRQILGRQRFRSPASEDLWFGNDLLLEGVRPRHVESARLRSANVGTWRAASGQRQRYEVGRMSAAREFVGRFLRRPTPARVEAATFLLTPPFAVSMGLLAIGAGLAAAAGATALVVVLLAGIGLLAATLFVGLVQAGASVRTWLSLLAAPWYVVWKLGVQARAVTRLSRPQSVDVPTAR